MLAFIDDFVIPLLNQLYGAVGYVGVMIAMAIESAHHRKIAFNNRFWF